MSRFFRDGICVAACGALLLLAACSKKGEVEAKTQADTEKGVSASATASTNGQANAPAPTATTTATAGGNTAETLIEVHAWDGTGEVLLQPGQTLTMPLKGTITFHPKLALGDVKVAEGPFKPRETTEGTVVIFDPSEAELAKLEKGEKISVKITLLGAELSFTVGLRKPA